MTISVDWPTREITVPLGDLTLELPANPPFGALYSYSVDQFRLELKDAEDSDGTTRRSPWAA
jgi:hypothetical protein